MRLLLRKINEYQSDHFNWRDELRNNIKEVGYSIRLRRPASYLNLIDDLRYQPGETLFINEIINAIKAKLHLIPLIPLIPPSSYPPANNSKIIVLFNGAFFSLSTEPVYDNQTTLTFSTETKNYVFNLTDVDKYFQTVHLHHVDCEEIFTFYFKNDPFLKLSFEISLTNKDVSIYLFNDHGKFPVELESDLMSGNLSANILKHYLKEKSISRSSILTVLELIEACDIKRQI